jgi:anthranilate/para-aminobenzoate synthase component II
MLLIVTREFPDPVNNLNNVIKSLAARNIPYKITRKQDASITTRKDIRGIIIPGTNHFRILPTEVQPELDLELYYLHHFPKLPVLGLCHGCQFLMVYYGGKLLKHSSFWPGSKEVELDLTVDKIFHGEDKIQNLEFYFHDLPIAPRTVREIAWLTRFRDGRRHACAFEFVKDRVYGFMFHPEAKKETHAILYNFYDNVVASASSSASSASSA